MVARLNSFLIERERRNRTLYLSLAIVRLFRKLQERIDVHSGRPYSTTPRNSVEALRCRRHPEARNSTHIRHREAILLAAPYQERCHALTSNPCSCSALGGDNERAVVRPRSPTEVVPRIDCCQTHVSFGRPNQGRSLSLVSSRLSNGRYRLLLHHSCAV